MGSLRLVGRLSKPQCEQEAPCVCNRLRRSKPRPPGPGPFPTVLRDNGAAHPPSHLQPVDRGPAFRLARKGLPHGRSRQSSEGPQRSAGPAKRVDGRDRPCVVNALRAQRGPYPIAPPTGLNPPTPLSGEPQFCPQILRKTRRSRVPVSRVARSPHPFLTGLSVLNVKGVRLFRRGVFALFMGLFARGCVSPVLISGGQQPSRAYPRLSGGQPSLETVPTVGLSPLRRAPFWTFARRSGTVPWEGRQACDGCDERIPGTYIRRAANRRPLHRSPEPSPVRSGRCCLRGCQSLPLVQRSPADERERTRTGTAPAGSGFGTQAPARTSRPTQPERGCWSGRGHQRCRVLGAARARKPRRNDLRHDAGCGSGLRAARSRRLASA